MNLFLLLLFAALIFIESRDFYNGFLSRPFFSCVILIFLGFNANFVIAAAVLVESFFLTHKPCGSSIYPEFSLAYFSAVIAIKDIDLCLTTNKFYVILFAIYIYIIISSFLISKFLVLKRKLLYKLEEKEIISSQIQNMKWNKVAFVSLFLSITFGFVSAYIIFFITHCLLYGIDVLWERFICLESIGNIIKINLSIILLLNIFKFIKDNFGSKHV